jgi:hypothetical protein
VLGTEAGRELAHAAASVPQRIVLVTPAMRTELGALKAAASPDI